MSEAEQVSPPVTLLRIKNGVYDGIWSGYVARCECWEAPFEFRTARGTRGLSVPCKITVEWPKIFVEAKNTSKAEHDRDPVNPVAADRLRRAELELAEAETLLWSLENDDPDLLDACLRHVAASAAYMCAYVAYQRAEREQGDAR